jgi:hypothetical protein
MRDTNTDTAVAVVAAAVSICSTGLVVLFGKTTDTVTAVVVVVAVTNGSLGMWLCCAL